MSKKKTGVRAVGKFIVAIFDDRMPGEVARWNKQVQSKSSDAPVDRIVGNALKLVYANDEEWKAHCIKVRVYETDVTFRVLDGSKFTEIVYRESSVIRTADEIREYCALRKKPLLPASDQGVLFFAEQVVWMATHLDEEDIPGDHQAEEIREFSAWLRGQEMYFPTPEPLIQKMLEATDER